jgi:hypothetical protein
MPPDDYQASITAVYAEIRRAGQVWVPYCLIDGPVA